MLVALDSEITISMSVWSLIFSPAKWSHIRFQRRTVPNSLRPRLRWLMRSEIPQPNLFSIVIAAHNIHLTGFNSFCINTIRSNPFLSPASRMITRSQNHSSHRWKKKSSTERIILPIERFKPALLPILSFITLSAPIAHWKIWHHARWKRASVRLLNETSVFESPNLLVFYYVLRRFVFSCLIFASARHSLKSLSYQDFQDIKWPYPILKSHRLVRIG